MVSNADAYERGVWVSQTALIPNFREGVQANPWFQLGWEMGLKHGGRAAGMMSQAKSEFPQVAARLKASRPGQPATFAVEDRFYFGKERFADDAKQIALAHPNKRKNVRPGAKAKMQNGSWAPSDDREADRIIKTMKELEGKCSKKRAEIFDIETKIIPRVIAMANAAKQKQDLKMLSAASNAASNADGVRYSFSRPGSKAKFEYAFVRETK